MQTLFLIILFICPTPHLGVDLYNSPTHTFTFPSYCRSPHCQERFRQSVHTLGCTHLTPTLSHLHARCPASTVEAILNNPLLKSHITRFQSVRVHLNSPTFDSLLPHPPSTPAFKALGAQSTRFASCSRTAGHSVTIYVIDTGCRPSHKELHPRATALLPPGKLEFNSANDEHGHGTHVAAIAAGSRIGVATRAEVVCIRALDAHNQGNAGVVARAVRMAATLHRRSRKRLGVVSVSVGVKARRSYRLLDRAMEYAARVGLVPVVAAGNAGGDACEFTPARAGGVITVAAGGRGKLAGYSNYGRCVDVVARGSGIWSAYVGGDDMYARSSGTSMAAPFVSGIAALVLANEGSVGVEGVRERLSRMQEGDGGFIGVDGYCRYEQLRSDPHPNANG